MLFCILTAYALNTHTCFYSHAQHPLNDLYCTHYISGEYTFIYTIYAVCISKYVIYLMVYILRMLIHKHIFYIHKSAER